MSAVMVQSYTFIWNVLLYLEHIFGVHMIDIIWQMWIKCKLSQVHMVSIFWLIKQKKTVSAEIWIGLSDKEWVLMIMWEMI